MSIAWKRSANRALSNLPVEPSRSSLDSFLSKIGLALRKPLTDKQLEVIRGRLASIWRTAKKLGAEEAKWTASFGKRDVRAIGAIARQQVLWVNNFYSSQLSDRVRAIAKEVILDSGLTPREAGKVLGPALRREFGIVAGGPSGLGRQIPARYAGNPDLYFRQLASTASHQSRTFGKLVAFQEAGVSTFRLINPNDERTGTICQQMHGQTFTVQRGVQHMDSILAATKPDEVKAVAPWLGEKQLQQALAGTKPGTPEATGKLEGLGMITPPFHPLCRTELVVLDAGGGPVVKPPPEALGPMKRPLPKPRKLQPADVLARSRLVTAESGQSVPLDGPFIENHDVRFRVEQIDGRDVTVVRFKVTEPKAKGVEDALVEAARTPGRVPKRERIQPFGKLVGKKDGGGLIKTEDEIAQIYAGGRRAQIGDVQVSMVRGGAEFSENQWALHNWVEMRIPTTDLRRAFESFKAAAEKMGIEGAGEFPREQYIAILRKARIINQWDKTLAARLRTASLEDFDEIWSLLVRMHPEVEKVYDTMRTQAVFPGRTAQYSKAQADYLAKGKGAVRAIYHDVHSPEVLEFILSGDGLLSSVERFSRGIFTRGMSTSEDFGTGGADSVFARLSKSSKGAKGVSDYSTRIYIDRAELGRSDWYAFPSDRFGTTNPTAIRARMMVEDIKETREFSSGNEIMFPGGISRDRIKSVFVGNDSRRQALIDRLHEKGITEVNGKKLEDFIVSDKSGIKL